VQATLQQAQARGLLEAVPGSEDATGEPGALRPSARGFDFLSDLQALFLPAAAPARPG